MSLGTAPLGDLSDATETDTPVHSVLTKLNPETKTESPYVADIFAYRNPQKIATYETLLKVSVVHYTLKE